MTTHPKCGKSWGGKRAEHCPACCETFSGTTAGDKHRIGEHGIDRRCANPAERGLIQDERGIWHLPGTWEGPRELSPSKSDGLTGLEGRTGPADGEEGL